MGHGVRLIPPVYVKPYVKRGPRTARPARLVTVTLANKLTRIVFAIMKTGECFRTGMLAKA
jgi:hypothetical protein